MHQRKNETYEEFKKRDNAAKTRWRDKDREKFRAYNRARYAKNREKLLARHKRWRDANNERVNSQSRARNKTEEYRAYRRKLRKHKHETDLNFRIKQSLRSRIINAVKGTAKVARTLELVGCDTEFLRLYLAAKFKEGMNWGNWGQWHIDHIIPCAEFDLTKPEQQKQCFHYSNLQPFWGIENIKKGKKLILVKP